MVKILAKYIRDAWIIISICIFLFLLLNVGAHYYLDHYKYYRIPDDGASLFVSRHSAQGMEIRKRVFKSDDEALLEAYARPPGGRPHSVLHFTEGASTPYYTVGVEGIRYLSGWSDESVRDLLSQKHGHVFVFGGSTTFGDGVPDDDTVVAYLNRLDTDNVYLNFGIQAYDSIREIDKLLYLLRKGLRPKQVMFIDGLNDVTTFARSPYEIHDTPRLQGLVFDRGEVPLIYGYPTVQNMLHGLAYSFPITHVIKKWIEGQRGPDYSHERKSANIHGMEDWQELMLYHYKWPSIHINRTDDLAEDVVQYYKEAIAFVSILGEAFGFVPHFIYQPIGLLESNQAFLAEEFSESDYLAIYRAVDVRIRDEIKSGGLLMLDCSRSISDYGVENSYVDATHYSPEGNSVFAKCIIDKINKEMLSRK
ncbi:MAG: hypothetical protein ABF290_09055 [Thiogranum sp.]